MLSYKIHISGAVFKTGFRYYLKAKATLLGITGVVYYKDEKTVGVIASGNQADLGKFIKYCMIGSSLVQITGIEIIEIPAQEYTSFEVEDDSPEITSLTDCK